MVFCMDAKRRLFLRTLMMMFSMKREPSEIGESLVITIPRQVCDLYKFNSEDKIKHGI